MYFKNNTNIFIKMKKKTLSNLNISLEIYLKYQ